MSAVCGLFTRHWYSFYGQSGLRSPVCIRPGCGHPNPRPLTDEDWAVLLAYRKLRGKPFRAVIEDAINERREAA